MCICVCLCCLALSVVSCYDMYVLYIQCTYLPLMYMYMYIRCHSQMYVIQPSILNAPVIYLLITKELLLHKSMIV